MNLNFLSASVFLPPPEFRLVYPVPQNSAVSSQLISMNPLYCVFASLLLFKCPFLTLRQVVSEFRKYTRVVLVLLLQNFPLRLVLSW